MNEVEPEADVVRTLHLAGVGVERVGLVVAIERIPAFGIAERRDTRRCTSAAYRSPAGRVRSFPESPGCPVRSWCRDREVRHPGRIASSRRLHRSGRSATPCRWCPSRQSARASNPYRVRRRRTDNSLPRLAKAEVAVHERIHGAVFEPQLVAFVAVPVDLRVDVVPVQTSACRC